MALGLDMKLPVGIAVAFGCPFEGRPPFERIKWIVDSLVGMGIREIGFHLEPIAGADLF